MLICIKQHLSSILSQIHEKINQHWGWVEKKGVAYNRKRVYPKAWNRIMIMHYFIYST